MIVADRFPFRRLSLTRLVTATWEFWDLGRICTSVPEHWTANLLGRPYGDPRGTRTLKYQRERLMTVSCSSMGPNGIKSFFTIYIYIIIYINGFV